MRSGAEPSSNSVRYRLFNRIHRLTTFFQRSGISDSTTVVTGPFLAVSKRLKDGDEIKSADKGKGPGDKDKTEEKK